MQKGILVTLSAGSILLLSISARAADDKPLSTLLNGNFSGNIGAYSDYKLRGISQTAEAPAVQGNIDFMHNSGVKVGVWASNVDFGGTSDATEEFDIYTAYTKSFDKLSTEAGLIYYAYPGAKSLNNYDYTEMYGILGYDFGVASVAASLNYSPDFFAASGVAYYPKLYLKVPLPKDFYLDGSVGHQFVDNNIRFGVPDYTDWSIGVAYTIEGFTAKVQYIDTNLSNNQCALDACEGKAVFSISKAF
jgi:uncharacterized protein (TIGR02001 family)